MKNTILKAKSKYLRDRNVITLTAGKIAYQNTNRRNNEAEIDFGFRYLTGNTEDYFTVTGAIWNHIHTDIVTGGASVHETIQKYIHDPLLAEMVELGKKYHLTYRSKMPKDAVKRVEEIIREMRDEYLREHPER